MVTYQRERAEFQASSCVPGPDPGIYFGVVMRVPGPDARIYFGVVMRPRT
jgi:hypothetical protein